MRLRESYTFDTDLVPLPHESTLSVLWRLGWRNALNAQQIMRLCHESHKTDRKSDELLFAAWIMPSYFHAQCGLIAPSKDETLIRKIFGCAAEVWFSSTFRCCPVCLQDGYHSTWHQLLLLRTCPAHQCPIVDQCQSCGRGLEELRFTSTMFDNVYFCSSCRGPIAGVKISLQGHLELRGQSYLLQRAFSPFVNWMQLIEPGMAIIRNIVDNNQGWRTAWQFWGRADDILMSLVTAVSEYSENCECRPRIAYSHLTWRSDLPANKWDNLWKKSIFVSDRKRIICNSSYRMVLRKIEEWMREDYSEPTVISVYANGAPSTGKSFRLNPDPMTRTASAYVNFRNFMENDYYCFPWYGRVEITRHPFRGSIYPCHFPRVACRAAFLALFAAFAYAMQSRKIRDRFIASGRRDEDILPIYSLSGCISGDVTGGVIFPQLDGFLTSKSELRGMHHRLLSVLAERRRKHRASIVDRP